jgi:hypothetical protein
MIWLYRLSARLSMRQLDMTNRFSVQAAADAQTLLRILNFFAQRDILPTKVVALSKDRLLTVVVDVAAMDDSARELIAEKIRQLVLVDYVQCDDH